MDQYTLMLPCSCGTLTGGNSSSFSLLDREVKN